MSDLELTIPYDYVPRNYQMPVWKFFEGGGRRGVCVWHRRAGKDLFGLNMCCTKMVERVGLYWHLFPTYAQGKKVVWDGFTKDGRPFLEYFPPPLISAKNNTEMKVALKNGSIYQVVGTDNVDRLVGANPVGCIFSEYSLQDPKAWDLIRPILSENGGWALFIYTPRARNHGWDLLEMSRRKDSGWFSQVLTVNDTNSIPLSAVDEERASGMPEELIQQEYFCSFDSPLMGAYYSAQMAQMLKDGRIGEFGWEPRLQVHTCWDLGMDDATSIWFVQTHGHEVRLIDYYENSGEGLSHYAKVLKEKEYVYGRHYAPFDIEVKELGTGKSRLEVAKTLGIRFTVVRQHAVEDGIEAVRNLLPRVYINKPRCQRGIDALFQYRKDWDEKNKTFRSHPVHDWASHPCDSLRYLAWGLRDKSFDKRMPDKKVITEYNMFRR